MSGCNFSISGVDFDVDKFLATSSFVSPKAYRRGDTTGLQSRPVLKTSGFSVSIFDFNGCGIETVIAEVTQFLSKYEAEIVRARTWPGVDCGEIAVLMSWFEDTAALPLHLPARFLQLVGHSGTSLTLLVCATSREAA